MVDGGGRSRHRRTLREDCQRSGGLEVLAGGRVRAVDGGGRSSHRRTLRETEKDCPLRKVLSQRTQRFCKNIVAKKFLAEKAEPQRRRDIMIVGRLEVKMRLRCGTKFGMNKCNSVTLKGAL